MAKHIVAVIDMICHCRDSDMQKYWTHFWHRRYGNCYTFNKGMDATGSYVNVMNTSKPGFGNYAFHVLKTIARNCFQSFVDFLFEMPHIRQMALVELKLY